MKQVIEQRNNSDCKILYSPLAHRSPIMHLILHKHCFQFFLGRLQYPGEMKNKGFAIFFWKRGGGIMADVQVANCKTQLYIMSYITNDSVTSIRPLIQFSQISKQSE